MSAFPSCDLASASPVGQLAALKRQKQSGSCPRIKGRGYRRNKGEEGQNRFDLSTSNKLFLGKQPFRNEPNDKLAHIALQEKSLHAFHMNFIVVFWIIDLYIHFQITQINIITHDANIIKSIAKKKSLVHHFLFHSLCEYSSWNIRNVNMERKGLRHPT